MILSDISIRRPVLATVMSLMLVVVGFLSYTRLSVREYPNIDPPVVSVRTVYAGASAPVVESQVTRPLEDALSGIEGIRVMKSVSREEVSQITVEFTLARDVDAASNDVRDRVARTRGRLPDAVNDPVVAKIEADAQAMLWMAFYSDRHSPLEITDFADRQVQDQLQTLPGVASVIIGGERRYAMRIWLDGARMAAHGVTARDVEEALGRQNLEAPGGRIEGQEREFVVFAQTDLRTPEEFENVVLRVARGYPVRLRDVGRAEIGAENERFLVRINGRNAVGLGVVKQSTANTLEVARAVKAELPRIREMLPEGMSIEVAFDRSVFIEEAIDSVYKTIFEALALVVLIIFAFLRSLRATLIPFVTIPVSLIGAFIFLHALGFSINILTLLALVLAIGIVVDDAIVVLENIYRRIEAGMEPVRAAFEGSREIAFAIIAMTLTLAAVFAPLAFMRGTVGRLFTEFALAVVGAVLISGFVALTLTPMMCSKILRHEARHGTWYRRTEAWIENLRLGYERALAVTLAHRWVVLLGAVLALAGAGVLFSQLRSELSPVEDRGVIVGVMVAPEGSTMAYTDRYAQRFEQMVEEVPEVVRYFSIVAPGLDRPNPVNSALFFVNLQPWSLRERKQQDISRELRPKMFGALPGVFAFPIDPPSLGQSFRNPPVQFVVQGPSYEELQEAMDALVGKAREFPGLVNMDTDLKLDKPQLSVFVDRAKAADLGVEVSEVGRTLETLLGGRQVTRFKRAGEQYDVILQLEAGDRSRPEDLGGLYVRARDGGMVQLANLISVQETVAPKELNHFDRLRSATLTSNVAPGYTVGDALAFLENAAREVLPAGMRVELDGQSREFRESAQEMYLTFGLALVFIYLVLAAQFESFRDPFVIMLSVPLAITGALLALWVGEGGTLNVYSQIGMVMLVGLVTKNGILIVEFANQLQARGRGVVEAVVEAAGLRLRPILMTTLTMILAGMPLAFATGAGAESRQQIGWVIVGGLGLGTLLTLFVIPTAYTLVARRREPAGAVQGA